MNFLDFFKNDKKNNNTQQQQSSNNQIDTVKIDISNKDKAEVLANLYNSYIRNSEHLHDRRTLTILQAREFLEQSNYYIECINECMIHINFENNIIDVTEYDCAHGKGSAEMAISKCHNIKNE